MPTPEESQAVTGGAFIHYSSGVGTECAEPGCSFVGLGSSESEAEAMLSEHTTNFHNEPEPS